MAEKYFGKYRGKVTAIDNSEGMWKIKAEVPKLLNGFTTGWALPCFSFTMEKVKMYLKVSVGDLVWVEFEQGDLDKPIWTGGWFKSTKEPDWQGIEIEENKLEWTKDKIIAHKDLEVKKNLTVKGNLTIDGNLTVNGTVYYKDMKKID